MPLQGYYHSCIVIVSMQPEVKDRSTWNNIVLTASQLVAGCTLGDNPLGKTGGVTCVGMNGRIRVSVERVPGMSVGSVNTSSLSEEDSLASQVRRLFGCIFVVRKLWS